MDNINNPNVGNKENPLAKQWANMDPRGEYKHITDAVERKIQEAKDSKDPLRMAVEAAAQKAAPQAPAEATHSKPSSQENIWAGLGEAIREENNKALGYVYENDYYTNDAGEMVPSGNDLTEREFENLRDKYSYTKSAERENKWRNPPLETVPHAQPEVTEPASVEPETKNSTQNTVETKANEVNSAKEMISKEHHEKIIAEKLAEQQAKEDLSRQPDQQKRDEQIQRLEADSRQKDEQIRQLKEDLQSRNEQMKQLERKLDQLMLILNMEKSKAANTTNETKQLKVEPQEVQNPSAFSVATQKTTGEASSSHEAAAAPETSSSHEAAAVPETPQADEATTASVSEAEKSGTEAEEVESENNMEKQRGKLLKFLTRRFRGEIGDDIGPNGFRFMTEPKVYGDKRNAYIEEMDLYYHGVMKENPIVRDAILRYYRNQDINEMVFGPDFYNYLVSRGEIRP
ncbi:hypothetical protein IKF34_01420 [Candidatus Saccharibacteria bacterium]|nr:hypothetical protein [Candidatus Saccharibacteria bacterium]